MSHAAFTRRAGHARRGATTVEFAITAPVFFLFLLAAFEFGWLNVIRHTADNAAYEAARTAMVRPSGAWNCAAPWRTPSRVGSCVEPAWM